MLKLIKHELKAIAPEFYGIMIALFALAFVGPFLLQVNVDWIIAIIILVFIGVMFAINIISIIVIFKVLNNRMFGHQGYLQLTLPISTFKLLMSKVLTTTIIYTIIGTLSAIALIIFALISYSLLPVDVAVTQYVIDLIFKSDLLSVFGQLMISIVPLGLAAFFSSLLLLMFVITFVHTSFVRKNRLLIGIVLFIGVNIVLSSVSGLVLSGEFLMADFGEGVIINQYTDPIVLGNMIANQFKLSIDWLQYSMHILYYVIITALFFSGAQYLIENKLEVE